MDVAFGFKPNGCHLLVRGNFECVCHPLHLRILQPGNVPSVSGLGSVSSISVALPRVELLNVNPVDVLFQCLACQRD